MPFGASILLMVYMILIKNKNKNKQELSYRKSNRGLPGDKEIDF